MSSRRFAFRLRQAARRMPIWAVLWAGMVLLQTLGLAHGIVHRDAASVRISTQGSASVRAAPGGGHRLDVGNAAPLFAGHEKGAGCTLYDALLQPDLLPASPVVMQTIDCSPQSVATPGNGGISRAPTVGFLARAPPRQQTA